VDGLGISYPKNSENSVKSLFDRLVERWAGIRMMEEEAKAEDVASSLRLNQELVRAHYQTHLGESFGESNKSGSTHIGDITHNHSETNTNGKKRWTPKMLLLGGLLASGGVGAALPQLFDLFGASSVIPSLGPDTQYNLKLGEPDEVPERAGKDQGR
jgi:hypothetical protein